MFFQKTNLEGVYIIKTGAVFDNRGYFERLFCKREYKNAGFSKNICQINHTLTKTKGSVRGMHYQIEPQAEEKIVVCLKGKIFDVVLDLRIKSKTFLKWQGFVLSSNNREMIYIPKGCAHGFQTLLPNCELLYLHTAYYDKKLERSVRYDDPKVNIKWKMAIKNISKKDSLVLFLPENFRGI